MKHWLLHDLHGCKYTVKKKSWLSLFLVGFYFIFLPCLSFLSCAFIYFCFFFHTPQLRKRERDKRNKIFLFAQCPLPILAPTILALLSFLSPPHPAQLPLALLSFLSPHRPAQSLSPTHAHKRGCWKILMTYFLKPS